MPHQQITRQEITPEHTACVRVLLRKVIIWARLLGSLLTAYQQAFPILPLGNSAALSEETQRHYPETHQ